MSKTKSTITLPVAFGDVSIGDETARIGVTIQREKLDLSTADHNFCNSRLEVDLLADDDPDQQHLEGMKPDQLNSVVDVKGFSVNAKRFHAGLTFALEEIDCSKLAKFARCNGSLKAKRIGDIPAKAVKVAANGEDDEDDDGDGQE